MKPIQWIAPALAMAIGLVPAMAAEQQPGAEAPDQQAPDQQQEVTAIDEQRLSDLQRTGTLLIVDLDAKQQDQAVDQESLSFDEAWQDRSLKGDVDESVRYVVFYSKDADQQQQKHQAARDAFEQSGFYQINYYYVLDENAIEQLQEDREQAGVGIMPEDEDERQAAWEQDGQDQEPMAQAGARQDDSKAKQHRAQDSDPANDKRVTGKTPEGKVRSGSGAAQAQDQAPEAEKRVAGQATEGKMHPSKTQGQDQADYEG